MSEGGQLLFILALVYLSGCIAWVDRRTVLFASAAGRLWKAVKPDYSWGNSSGRIWLLNPLPPFGFAVKSRLLPVSVSPTHIVAFNSQTLGNSGRPPQPGRIVQIRAGARFSRKGSVVLANGKPFCDANDGRTAHSLVVLLNGMKRLDEAGREKAIREFWERRLDAGAARRVLFKAMAADFSLRAACSLAFAFAFAIVPALSVRYGLGAGVLAGGAGMYLAAWCLCVAVARRAFRMHPASRGGVWTDVARMAVCPPSAFRACDSTFEKETCGLDPLAVAYAVLDGEERESFVASYLADLESAEAPESRPAILRETCRSQNRVILSVVSKLQAADKPREGDGPPPRRLADMTLPPPNGA